MKKEAKTTLSRRFYINLSVWLLFTLAAFQTRAGEQQLQLTVQACTVTVKALNGDGCKTNQCSGDSSCVCLSKGQHAKWLLTSEDKFKLKFSGNSPLKDNCGKNFKADKHKCVVKESVNPGESYSYEVMLERCANGTDPRIIVQ